MSATKRPAEEIRSPTFGWARDEFHAEHWNVHAVLLAVTDALERRVGMPNPHERAGRFRTYLKRALQRLDRPNRETGPDVEEHALRAAVEELERAHDTMGGHTEGTAGLTRSAGYEVNTPVSDLFYGAGIVVEWALTGCRARLAEMEDEATPRENGDGGDPDDLMSDVVDALALGGRAALDLAPELLREEAERVALEVQGVRRRVEDRLGIDGEESEARITEARERFERLVEGGKT